MNHLLLLLLLLAGCSSSVSTEKTEREPTPTPASSLVPHAAPLSTLIEVQEHKALVEKGMRKIIDQMKAYPGSNPDALAQAEAELTLFRDHFVAMRVEEVRDGLRVAEVATCANTPCFGYTVADAPNTTGVIAAYDSESHAITFSASAKGDDPYAAFVVFHELSHMDDQLRGLVQTGGDLGSPIVPGTPNPSETQAYAFEGELLNGATRGQYFALATATGQAVLDRKIDYIGIEPGPVIFFDIPDSLYGIVEGGATMSVAGRQAMAMTFLITVNRGLIPTYPSVTSAEEAQRHQDFLYNDTRSALAAPQVQDFVRKHMAE